MFLIFQALTTAIWRLASGPLHYYYYYLGTLNAIMLVEIDFTNVSIAQRSLPGRYQVNHKILWALMPVRIQWERETAKLAANNLITRTIYKRKRVLILLRFPIIIFSVVGYLWISATKLY